VYVDGQLLDVISGEPATRDLPPQGDGRDWVTVGRSSDGKLAVASDNTGRLCLWSMREGKPVCTELTTWKQLPETVEAGFDSKNEQVAVVCTYAPANGDAQASLVTRQLWRVATGKEVPLVESRNMVNVVSWMYGSRTFIHFADDGKYLAVMRCGTADIMAWETQNGTSVRPPIQQSGHDRSQNFWRGWFATSSGDGKRELMTANGKFCIWELRSGVDGFEPVKVGREFPIPFDSVSGQLSWDGHFVAIVAESRTQLWDVARGQYVGNGLAMQNKNQNNYAVRFSPDVRQLMTVSPEGMVTWDISPVDLSLEQLDDVARFLSDRHFPENLAPVDGQLGASDANLDEGFLYPDRNVIALRSKLMEGVPQLFRMRLGVSDHGVVSQQFKDALAARASKAEGEPARRILANRLAAAGACELMDDAFDHAQAVLEAAAALNSECLTATDLLALAYLGAGRTNDAIHIYEQSAGQRFLWGNKEVVFGADAVKFLEKHGFGRGDGRWKAIQQAIPSTTQPADGKGALFSMFENP
jgi:hypothetical protein